MNWTDNLQSTYRDGGILDRGVTEVEQDVDDLTMESSDVMSDYSIVGLVYHLTTDLLLHWRWWRKLNKDRFRRAFLNSEMRNRLSFRFCGRALWNVPQRPTEFGKSVCSGQESRQAASMSCVMNRPWVSCSPLPFAPAGTPLPEVKGNIWQTCLDQGGEE